MKHLFLKKPLVALFSVTALAMAGMPGGVTAHHAHASPLVIGFFGPLSGPNAAAGIDMENAAKLAVANVNKSGGVLGQQVVLDAQDDACTAQIGVQAAQKLVTDGVVAVVGGYCSGATIPASTIYHRAGLAMVTPAATNPKLTSQGFDDIFRTIGRDDEQGAFVAGIMVKKLHATRIALIHDNTVYGKGLAEQARLSILKYAGTQVVFFDAITSGSKDFSSILTKVRTANPQITYFTGYYADGGLLAKQFKQLQVPGTLMAGDSNNDPTFIKLAGAAAQGVLISTAPIPQLLPSAAGFVKQFTATYSMGPGAYSAYTYDAASVVLAAIKAAGSTSAAAIVKALHATKNFPGVTGPITLSATGDRVQIQYIVITVKNGQFVAVKM